MQEEEIIAGLRARNRQTTEYLYEKYSRALMGVILRIISDHDIAEEVFHDSFIKITRKIDSYEESKGRLYTWMANICRNSAIDKLRSKEISQTGKTNAIDDFVFGIESQSGTLEHVEGIGVRELMNQLTADQKFIIEYIYFQGYTHSEISEEFDIPLGTVKSRVRAALQVLKKNLEKI
ncbi:MAG: sigma-70 family RNA polymerase sigma factor [Cytophagales bacterium]|uniref:Sigma-70 family RNA polymerase sigma factor n=1 Tax=Algoriphagus taiwanensis TaxID=1445656 RepID=A0ABQ6Q3B0_9BACT|nr:MAG: sigma-70 family RNA polymerase sigma factor [Cytophagales bacterium]GMQ34667.1 sigma-70 family RNA polymerase sigma factor [Algoriphagus taiwanensis]